mmetsp:Transcript_12917/g.1977  ORF Transcript_12917/g.1977 Transcript_12917/m.1977 type:complete len:160 (+) Transcript_12917:886-1365(+)
MITFGMVVYSFEGIPLVLPIKQSMKDSSSFERVLIAMMCTHCVTLCTFGVLYYFTFGNSLFNIVTAHFPDTVASTTMLSFYLIAVIFSFPMAFVPINIIAETIYPKMGNWINTTMRVGEVLFALVCGILLSEYADKYLSLLGSIFCAPLAIIIPALIHL